MTWKSKIEDVKEISFGCFESLDFNYLSDPGQFPESECDL